MNPQNIKKAEKLTSTQRKKVVGTFKKFSLLTSQVKLFKARIEHATSNIRRLSSTLTREKLPPNGKSHWVRISAVELENKFNLIDKSIHGKECGINRNLPRFGARLLCVIKEAEGMGFQVYKAISGTSRPLYMAKEGEEVLFVGKYQDFEPWVMNKSINF